ncbi:hypothetical protein ACCC97_07540 [Variovorax sp. Varisp85]
MKIIDDGRALDYDVVVSLVFLVESQKLAGSLPVPTAGIESQNHWGKAQ